MDYSGVAHSPFLWACVVAVFLIVTLQSVVFIRAALKEAPTVGLTRSDVAVAVRTGAISALGPSLGIVVLAVGLLSLFGGPAVLMRIGLIGSAGFELIAADTGAGALGLELGGQGFDGKAFATVFTVMSLGGAMWMTSTLLLTPVAKRVDLAVRKRDGSLLQVVTLAAMAAAFGFITIQEPTKSPVHLSVLLAATATAVVMQLAAGRFQRAWLREWSLAVAMTVGLLTAGIAG
ncbi:DUF5058 family protein [Saccharomonospora iraqiensis]|uniref:DUF5058 family protein n=1 Tax=Saccharomonospora iraqiensis TaxID=52698 RepID=UPI0004096F88|nr:DUF5058 family protein [Saccharomonospora iraqiensis]